jgi:serine/threonine protein kinase
LTDHHLVGTTIADKYLVKRLLGEGGMGSVFEGENVELGKRVAIKVIAPMFAGSPDIAERFRREARAASKVESDNIVDVFDVGTDPVAGLFMVMEMLSGEDLSVRLEREKRLDPSLVVGIGIQVARALAKAHTAGVIHRDLKPANLFLIARDDDALAVKILDFGISKLTTDARSPARSDPPRALTRAGAVIGTAQYMSPEQAQGLPVDLRTDVWSLGAVLYELLAGVPAYPPMETYEQTIIQIVTRLPTPIAAVAPWVPAELAAVVHAALTPEISARLPDCGALAKRLLALTADTGARASLAGTPQPPLPAHIVVRPSGSGLQANSPMSIVSAEIKGQGAEHAGPATRAHATEEGVAIAPFVRLRPSPTTVAAVALVIVGIIALVGLRAFRSPARPEAARAGAPQPLVVAMPPASVPPPSPLPRPPGVADVPPSPAPSQTPPSLPSSAPPIASPSSSNASIPPGSPNVVLTLPPRPKPATTATTAKPEAPARAPQFGNAGFDPNY